VLPRQVICPCNLTLCCILTLCYVWALRLLQADGAEDAEVRSPPPPTDTPAGDLALAASQLDQEGAGAGQAWDTPPAAAAAASQAEPQQQQDEAAADEEQQHKKRPRIVAT
jgi:hypothetical protein